MLESLEPSKPYRVIKWLRLSDNHVLEYVNGIIYELKTKGTKDALVDTYELDVSEDRIEELSHHPAFRKIYDGMETSPRPAGRPSQGGI